LLLFCLLISFIPSLDWFQVVERIIFLALSGYLMRFFLIVESIISILLFHKKIELSMLFTTGQLIFSIERICEKLFISLPFILICQWIAVNL
jgi:hypothetical protein